VPRRLKRGSTFAASYFGFVHDKSDAWYGAADGYNLAGELWFVVTV
jgi:hypothetical protein